MTTVVAAAAFWRIRIPVMRLPSAGITAYLGVVLVLCKSLGALVYGAVLVPLVRFTKPRLQLRLATVLVSIALLYPMLRAADLFPAGIILDAATSISTERASSLKTRFYNENLLVERASQRPLFGWGRWGRNRVYDDYGKDISVTDGRWIIVIGQFGLFGFLVEFGLLMLPVFRAALALRYAQSIHDEVMLAALTLILSINIVDLLPNASLSPWTWLLAGALLGRAEALRAMARGPARFERYPKAAKSVS
jgi:hypothetical protein